MKKLSFIALMGATSLFVFSCQDDEVNSGTDFPEKFSKLSVEENKAQLENNGISLVNELEDLRDSKSVEATVNLVRLFTFTDEEESPDAPSGGRLLNSVSNLQKDPKSAKEIFSALRLASEEPESIQAYFNEHAGTYTWVAATEEWESTLGGDDIIFEFPSTEAGTKNNAVLTMGSYQGTQISNPIDDEYTGDLPTNFLMDLTVDGAKVLEYSFKATYNNEGIPNSLDTYLAIEPYKYAVTFSNDSKKIDISYNLTKGEKALMAAGASSNGNFTQSNFDSSSDPSDLVTDAAAYFQLMNIKVSGSLNVKGLIPALEAIDYDNLSEKEYSAKEAEAYNQNYKLMVYYDDSKEKIADTEFYTHTTSEFGYEYTDVEIRMIFADGSKSDFETYFETGFSELQKEVESLMEVE